MRAFTPHSLRQFLAGVVTIIGALAGTTATEMFSSMKAATREPSGISRTRSISRAPRATREPCRIFKVVNSVSTIAVVRSLITICRASLGV